MGDLSKLQAAPSLPDPATCGEDLARMASRMTELAPSLCLDCAEYHTRFAITRYAAPDKGIAVDRSFLIDRIQHILTDAAGRSGDVIQIVIAGSADTGVLATCAHAAAVMGYPIHSRCRFTVLDRCKSPLTLCEEFADRHGFRLQTAQVDLSAVTVRFDADLIVAHSLFRFMDRSRQIALLRKFDEWLKPHGRIIVSQSIRPHNEAHLNTEVQRRESNLALAQAAVSSGALKIGREAELLLKKIRGSVHDDLLLSGDLASAGDLRNLMSEAGLREYSIDVISKEIPLTADNKFERVRTVAIFGSNRKA